MDLCHGGVSRGQCCFLGTNGGGRGKPGSGLDKPRASKVGRRGAGPIRVGYPPGGKGTQNESKKPGGKKMVGEGGRLGGGITKRSFGVKPLKLSERGTPRPGDPLFWGEIRGEKRLRLGQLTSFLPLDQNQKNTKFGG